MTYVFVPALALLQAGYLQGPFGVVLASLILMSSLFHFSDTESKTEDHCFVGFPADLEYRRLLCLRLPHAALAGQCRRFDLRGLDVRADGVGAPHAHADALAWPRWRCR